MIAVKRYAAVWLMVLMMVSSVSIDRYIVDCIRSPLVCYREPSKFEIFVVSNFQRAYPVFMRVYDFVQGVMQKVLLMSEESAKN